MSPWFEPQLGAYTVSVNDTHFNPYSVKLTPTVRDGQTVTMALAEQVEGATIIHKGAASNPVHVLKLTNGTVSGSQVTGTAVVNVTVSQSGHTSTVYVLTVNYSIVEPEPETAD